MLEEKIKPKIIIVTLQDKGLSLDLDDYVIGVVSGEMPALFHEEALKAQAVAARSYAASKLNGNNINISASINDQVFLTKTEMLAKWGDDYKKYYDRITRCVLATNNEVLKKENVILKTYYFAMSNGFTEDSKSVFNDTTFTSTHSKWDNDSLINFEVEKKFTAKEILKGLNLNENNIVINNIVRNETNHVEKITINNQEFKGTEFRKALNLRSTDFTITRQDEDYLITTIGYGHGVGMSQYGANGMAKEGYNYQDILKHYYNNHKLENI